MRTLVIPNWLKTLPGDAYINSKEIVKLFGYSENTHPHTLLKSGSIPKPSRICEKSDHKNLMWRVSMVRNYIRQAGIGGTGNHA